MSVKDGNDKLSTYFIQKTDADINFRDKYGKSALMYACEAGNYKLVDLLLEKKADPNLIDKVYFIL